MAGWKKDENGAGIFDTNGNPVYVHDDGKEAGWNVPGTLASIKELTTAKAGLKTERDSLKAQLDAIIAAVGEDSLKQPDKLKKALETLADAEVGNLVAKGKEAEAVKKALAEAEKAYSAKLTAYEKTTADMTAALAEKTTALRAEAIKNAFANSPALKKLAPKLPIDLAAQLFGSNLKEQVIDGKAILTPYIDGEIMYSVKPEKAGKPADFDEAFERLFNSYPHKAVFMPDVPGGPAATGGGTGNKAAGDVILSATDAMNFQKYQAAKEQATKAGGQVIIQ